VLSSEVDAHWPRPVLVHVRSDSLCLPQCSKVSCLLSCSLCCRSVGTNEDDRSFFDMLVYRKESTRGRCSARDHAKMLIHGAPLRDFANFSRSSPCIPKEYAMDAGSLRHGYSRGTTSRSHQRKQAVPFACRKSGTGGVVCDSKHQQTWPINDLTALAWAVDAQAAKLPSRPSLDPCAAR
jgi:hypothetical protein